LGLLAAGYLFAPAPSASNSRAVPTAKVAPPAAPKPESTLTASRPPVPLVTPARATAQPTIGATSSDGPADPNAPKAQGDVTPAVATSGDGPADGDDSQARRAIEFDGYKNVRGLVKGPDGSWRGRAMRGRTEIAVRVDASGNVSAE
jgi:hypothetical protein